MKTKAISLIIGLAAVACVADSYFRSSTSVTATGSYTFTNQSVAPVCVSGLELYSSGGVEGTGAVYRLRGSVTNGPILSLVGAGSTAIVFNRAELDGIWFLQNDSIYITTGTTNAATIIVHLEESR